ncbi:MAG: hypothetical protein RR292_06805, partial [Christensenellaceae bacterium]
YGFQTEFFRMAVLPSLALTTAKRRSVTLPCKKTLFQALWFEYSMLKHQNIAAYIPVNAT